MHNALMRRFTERQRGQQLLLALATILLFTTAVIQAFSQSPTLQLVYTSDQHYGITRASFRGATNVDARIVNAALVARINSVPSLTIPSDGGVDAGKQVNFVDYFICTGDIANREETPIQSAAASWEQFRAAYIDSLTIKNHSGQKAGVLLLPGNHDVSDAIGYYKSMVPPTDSSSMVNIYNMMMPSPRSAGKYDYANERIHYSRDIAGIHFVFVCIWPDSAERVWMAMNLQNVSATTPVVIFSHDQPLVESKHFTNPNGVHNINATDKFENLLLESFKDGSTTSAPSTTEQRGFVSFLKSHPNIVAYFHGNDNANEFYTYVGPDSDVALNTFRVDSPMKGNVSSSDETRLSFQLISVDTATMTMTVRECLWNTLPLAANTPVIFGASKTVSLKVGQPLVTGPAYMKGDFHQHTTYTDGSNSFATMMHMNNKYGLDWWANSEHGGSFATDASGILLTSPPFDTKEAKYFDAMTPNPILGKSVVSGGHQAMWRWQSLRDYSFSDVLAARTTYPNRMILQSLEWNCPGHEHCSMGLIANQFSGSPTCRPLAEFEYKFDASDADDVGGASQGWVKSTNANNHTKAVEAATWLEQNYPTQSYLVFAHPERKSLYTIADFRDFNNAAPDVAFGFESQPGHQKGSEGLTARGEYGKSYKVDGLCTYGGTGIYAAKVGGVWDALLGEGRKWWLFANSDCHAVGADAAMKTAADFFPGEYQKNYTYVLDRTSAQSIVDGMRSGNTFVVMGDLIDSMDFKVNGGMMGNTVNPLNGKAVITITVHDPQTPNFNSYSTYTNPVLDHIDVIAGNVTGKKTPGTSDYISPVNASTQIVARFDAIGGVKDVNNLASKKWTDLGNGLRQMSVTLDVAGDMYVRLRGTNQGLNVPNETDGAGNPLPDTLITATAASAFADLWFYSNPVFVSSSLAAILPDSTAPTNFQLSQNYPNPFNPTTAISYQLPVASSVRVAVYDLLGREVAVLVNEKKEAGTYQVTFDATHLASGVYVSRLTAGDLVQSKKMILLK